MSSHLCVPLLSTVREDFNHRTRRRPRPISQSRDGSRRAVMLACSHVAVDMSRLYSGFAYTIAARSSSHFRPAPTLTALSESQLTLRWESWALPLLHTGANAPLQALCPTFRPGSS